MGDKNPFALLAYNNNNNNAASKRRPTTAEREKRLESLRKGIATRKIGKFVKGRFNFGRPDILLCDRKFTQKLMAETEPPTLQSLYVTTNEEAERGEGTYGKAQSAEIRVEGSDGKLYGCLAIVKSSKGDTDVIRANGFESDVLTELSVYARIRNTKMLAKCLFAKIQIAEQRYVMEHYISNLYYFHLELLSSLDDSIQNDYRRAIVFQIAKGLQEIHALNIIHKDLKPENILVGTDGRLMLTDYGLSVYVPTGITRAYTFIDPVGTAYYEPPEGTTGSRDKPYSKAISSKYDMWSLGVLLVELYGIKNIPYYIFNYKNLSKYFIGRGWPGKEYGQGWRGLVKPEDYERSVRYVLDTYLAVGNLSITQAVHDVLRGLLTIDPAERWTTTQVLESPWLAGMTLEKSMKILRSIGMVREAYMNIAKPIPYKTAVGANVPITNLNKRYTRTKRADIIATTARRGAAGATRNAEVDKYFPLLHSKEVGEYSKPIWNRNTDLDLASSLDLMSLLLGACVDKKIHYSIFLHAIELFHRCILIAKLTVNENLIYSTLTCCINIAYKLSPVDINKGSFSYSIAKEVIANVSNLINIEQFIISKLWGDLFPKVNGFVDQTYKIFSTLHAAERIRFAIVAPLFFSAWDGKSGRVKDCLECARFTVQEKEIPAQLREIAEQIKSTCKEYLETDNSVFLHAIFKSGEEVFDKEKIAAVVLRERKEGEEPYKTEVSKDGAGVYELVTTFLRDFYGRRA